MWFSNHLAGTLIYIPAAVAGALLPFRLAHKQGISVSSQVAGSCLFHAILAVILTVVGGKVAYSHFCWAAAAYVSLWIVPKVKFKASNHVIGFTCVTHVVVVLSGCCWYALVCKQAIQGETVMHLLQDASGTAQTLAATDNDAARHSCILPDTSAVLYVQSLS